MRAAFLAPAAAAIMLGALAGAAGSATGQTTVDVFPAEDTPTASPTTQVSFRGVAPRDLTGMTVTGSRTGPHAGRLVAHSDGQGASFLPAAGFRAGETVTVRAAVPLTGARDGAVTFGIARYPSRSYSSTIPKPDREGRPRDAYRSRTRPDLYPPSLKVLARRAGASTDPIFVAAKAGPGQDGPEIVDAGGQLVWFRPVPRGQSAYDFRAQTYRGRPVLTWWEGRVYQGKGVGVGRIFDSSYRSVARVRAANGYQMDHHELQLTDRGTAFVNIYQPVRTDLSAAGGPRHGSAFDSVVQEIDIATGLVVWEWHSQGQVPLTESYFRPLGRYTFDYAHVNSACPQPDGSVLLSARNTNALYDVDRHTGRIVWRLGGSHSDWKMGPGTGTIGQHQAVTQPNGEITLFDNGGSRTEHPQDRESRGLVLRLDARRHSVSLAHEYRHPGAPLHSRSQGSIQRLSNGDVVLSWGGSNPFVTELTAEGRPMFEARFAPQSNDTYRAYRMPWSGARPSDPPAIVYRRTPHGARVYVSWNGATDVVRWELLTGARSSSLASAGTFDHRRFEDHVEVRGFPRVVAVRARAADGHVLGQSRTVGLSH